VPEFGEVVLRIHAMDTPDEHVVVHRADPLVLAEPENVRDWLGHRSPLVRVHGDGRAVSFGTPGVGEGVVFYRIGKVPDLDEALAQGWPINHWYRGVVPLTRIDADEIANAWEVPSRGE
jgi:hypothetical protein